MKTDNKTMASIYRKMADNLDKGLDENDSIQCSCGSYGWGDKNHVGINSLYQYRIKPETITLKNGVTIPKPLDYSNILEEYIHYFPSNNIDLYGELRGSYIISNKILYPYKTSKEAIEASKALFGIE